MSIYVIPYQGKYIIYRPLKRLAFLANAALVNWIAGLWQKSSGDGLPENPDALRFLESIGFLEPDSLGPPPASNAAPFKPTVAVCLLTTACNFRCIYCYASSGTGSVRELPFELGQQAINTVCRNAMETGQERFSLSFHGGGEPTLAQDCFRKLAHYARSRKIPCDITIASNGYWSRPQRKWILDHLDHVSLSFDGTQALQDRQRPLASGKGSFAVVMETIQAMDQRDFPYGIRITVTDMGIDQLPPAIEFLCRETNCQTFQVEPAFNHGRARGDNLALHDHHRFATAFLEAHDAAVASGRHLYYSGARPWVITHQFCQAIDHALIVTPDGELSACYEIHGGEHPLAPAFLFGSLAADGRLITKPEARQRLRDQIAERRALCQDCFCYWHCAGDCPPKTLSLNGDEPHRFGARCDLNRLITRELLVRYIAAGHGLWLGNAPMKQSPYEAPA